MVLAKIKETSEGKAQAPRTELDPAKASLDPSKIEDILDDGLLITPDKGRPGVDPHGGVKGEVTDGDFAMYEDELQAVLKALRAAGIHIVAIHSHMSMEAPRVAFLHYWGIGSTSELAKALKSALDTQRKTP